MPSKDTRVFQPVSDQQPVEVRLSGPARPMSRFLGADKKWYQTVEINGQPVELVKRMSLGETLPRNWRLFHDLGFPVVPDMYFVPQEQVVYMTNLCADGSQFYTKGQENFLDMENNYPELLDEARPNHLDHVFVEVIRNQVHQIRREVYRLVNLANKNHLLLPQDDPFDLLIHPDVTWDLYVLDLALGGYLTDVVRTEFVPYEFARVLKMSPDKVTPDYVLSLSESDQHRLIKTMNQENAKFVMNLLENNFDTLNSR